MGVTNRMRGYLMGQHGCDQQDPGGSQGCVVRDGGRRMDLNGYAEQDARVSQAGCVVLHGPACV